MKRQMPEISFDGQYIIWITVRGHQFKRMGKEVEKQCFVIDTNGNMIQQISGEKTQRFILVTAIIYLLQDGHSKNKRGKFQNTVILINHCRAEWEMEGNGVRTVPLYWRWNSEKNI